MLTPMRPMTTTMSFLVQIALKCTHLDATLDISGTDLTIRPGFVQSRCIYYFLRHTS